MIYSGLTGNAILPQAKAEDDTGRCAWAGEIWRQPGIVYANSQTGRIYPCWQGDEFWFGKVWDIERLCRIIHRKPARIGTGGDAKNAKREDSGKKGGWIINIPILRDGIKRIVNNLWNFAPLRWTITYFNTTEGTEAIIKLYRIAILFMRFLWHFSSRLGEAKRTQQTTKAMGSLIRLTHPTY